MIQIGFLLRMGSRFELQVHVDITHTFSRAFHINALVSKRSIYLISSILKHLILSHLYVLINRSFCCYNNTLIVINKNENTGFVTVEIFYSCF